MTDIGPHIHLLSLALFSSVKADNEYCVTETEGKKLYQRTQEEKRMPELPRLEASRL